MKNSASRHGRDTTRRARVLLSYLVVALVAASGFAQDIPLRTQKGDIQIWDEQYLRGPPKGWTAPEDYHEVFGRDMISREIRYGRFGLLSGQRLYTSWRPIVPLTDEQYAQGKVKLLDNHTSQVITPPFEIKNDFITMLISGANIPGEACVNLLIDGKVVRTATGANHDILTAVAFDVKALKGKQAQIQVLDTSTNAFGYVTVDCVYQSIDPKGAIRVIAHSPEKTVQAGSVRTISGTTSGRVNLDGGILTVADQPVDPGNVLELRTGVAAEASDAGSRVQLTNGDLLAGEISGIAEQHLKFVQPTLGPLDLSLDHVAQTIFMPGPTVQAEPGTLVQINNRLVPGKLKWIREDTIAIDCSLGLVPLPRTRVRSFVFAKAEADSGAGNLITFTDGSMLSGQLAVNDQDLVLKHALLGDLTLTLEQVSSIKRRLSKARSLADLKGEVVERIGPIPPPAPETINGASGQTLRMFPGTVLRYALPASEQPRSLRAELMLVSRAQAGVKVTARAKGKTASFSLVPGGEAQVVDFDMGTATVLELETAVDASQSLKFPSGIIWRNARIVEVGGS